MTGAATAAPIEILYCGKQAGCGVPLIVALTSDEITAACGVANEPASADMVPAALAFDDLYALLNWVL